MQQWDDNIRIFISLAEKHGVKMLMVGGGAVNFHGYQRHSADVDFWIEPTADNFRKLINVFNDMGYEIDDFPDSVKQQQQNISLKFSPAGLDLELITNFEVNKSFSQAYDQSELVILGGNNLMRYNVLSLEDLIISKVKAGRPKDLLDIQQLKQINKLD